MSSRQQYSGKSARLEERCRSTASIWRAGNGQEEEVSGLERTARQACAMHDSLHGGLHVVDEHPLGGAGGIDIGDLDLDGMLRHQRRGRVMEDRIGLGLQVAPVLVVNGEPGRLPVCRGIGILAPRKGEAALEILGVVQVGEMVHRPDGNALGEGDGVLAAVEESIDKILPLIICVRLEADDDVRVVLVLVIALAQAGCCQQGHSAQEGAPYHFFLHTTKLHIFL